MTKDNKTWLHFAYTLFALLTAYLSYQILNTVGQYQGWAERYDEWYPLVSNVVSVATGGGITAWLALGSVERSDYYLNTVAELKKISWPSLPDVKKMTVIVVIVVAIFAVILGLFDVTWSKILQSILPS